MRSPRRRDARAGTTGCSTSARRRRRGKSRTSSSGGVRLRPGPSSGRMTPKAREPQSGPLERLDGRFAWDSGEGDRSLEGLRTMYWDYVVAECTRLRRRATRKTPLVCEWFRVVYKEPLRDGANDGTHGRGTRG